MGIISIEHSDKLFWLGRYSERVYTTLRLFAKSYDMMIDLKLDDYIEFCEKLDIPNIYTSNRDFSSRYCFDENDINSIYSNLIRSYDNAIVLREEIGSEALSYIQLAIYDMQKAQQSHAPLIQLQKVLDDIMAFWGMIDDATENTEARNIIKTGKHVERLSLYSRLHQETHFMSELHRLQGRIMQTQLPFNRDQLESLIMLATAEQLDYYGMVYAVEHLL